MLKIQEDFIKYLDELYLITQDQKAIEYKNNIKNQELLIPFVGMFSAGKSSAINSFLGSKILSTDIDPKTAAPTELFYGEEEKIIACKQDGTSLVYDIDQLDDLSTKNNDLAYIKLYLNNENLKQIEPFKIVDMPGYCSTIKTHDSAISNYLSKGAFFVIFAIAKGTIQEEVLKEIFVLKQARKPYIVCVSKSDSYEHFCNLKEHYLDILSQRFRYKQDLVYIPKDCQNEIKELFKTIKPDEIFKKIYLNLLLAQHKQHIDLLNTRLESAMLNKEECEKVIENINNIKQNFKAQKSKLKDIITTSKKIQAIDMVALKVREDIINESDNLANIALSNQNQLEKELSKLISDSFTLHSRRVLSVLKDDIISLAKQTLGDILLDEYSISSSKLDGLAEQIRLDLSYKQHEQNDFSTTDETKNIILQGISIAASIFLPATKLVKFAISCVPFIYDLFGDDEVEKSKKRLERRQKQSQISSIKEQISNYAQKIEREIKQNYEKDLSDYIDKLLEQVLAKFDLALEDYEKAYKDELEQKSQDKEQTELNINTYTANIVKLEKLKEQYLVKDL